MFPGFLTSVLGPSKLAGQWIGTAAPSQITLALAFSIAGLLFGFIALIIAAQKSARKGAAQPVQPVAAASVAAAAPAMDPAVVAAIAAALTALEREENKRFVVRAITRSGGRTPWKQAAREEALPR